MQANRNTFHTIPSLPPFPEGWYFIGHRKSILKAKLIRKTWMGEEIVVWCDGEGRICVAEATCPHLGSDLGPATGGKVRNDCLVCPFHGYKYDITGQCVATPYAPAPRATRLKTFETREVLDLVFAWWGVGGRPPQWSLPESPSGDPEWGGIDTRTMRFPSHPQETTENSVDIAHLRYIHGYSSVHPVGSVSVDGVCLKSCFDFKRTRVIAGIKTHYDVSATTFVYGMGYSYVEIREHSIGMDARLWVLSTPVDGTQVEMVLASQIREMRKPKRLIVGLRFIPLSWRAKVMNQIIINAQKRDVLQDVIIWGKKRYQSRPRLCQSDGEIRKYRHYCEQFYPEHQITNQSERGSKPCEHSDLDASAKMMNEQQLS